MARFLVLVVLSACGPEVGSVSVEAPDVAALTQMQPFLEGRCATLDCHGDEGRPLRLYSETGLRGPAVDRASPLGADELEANAWSLVNVDPGAPPLDHLVYLKPLAEREGGMHHVGGDVFVHESAESNCIFGWLAGETTSSWAADCDTANARWAPPN